MWKEAAMMMTVGKIRANMAEKLYKRLVRVSSVSFILFIRTVLVFYLVHFIFLKYGSVYVLS